jgi:hypothetical protein
VGVTAHHVAGAHEHTAPAGDGAKWFQKNLLRSSRHVQYW